MIPHELTDNYFFIRSDSPNIIRHGSVGLFFVKNTFTSQGEDDLLFIESIIVALCHQRKNIFYNTVWKPSQKFRNFLKNVENLYQKMKNENLDATFISNDFNYHL